MQNANRKNQKTANLMASQLSKLALADDDYWSYKKMARRSGMHGIVRYPAMMVPRMQADILSIAAKTIPNLTWVYDPFVGAGTTLLETLRQGINFYGVDINPLAILICQAKLLNLAPSTLEIHAKLLLITIAADRSTRVEVDFKGRDKWFTKNSVLELSKIRRAIIAERNQQIRIFFWAILSETIRQTSMSRETTYKLHIRSAEDVSGIEPTLSCFNKLVSAACDRYKLDYLTFKDSYKKSRPQAILHGKDVRIMTKTNLPKAQLLLTSPPYGDNHSTIPYGQFSYLALNWIANQDLISSHADLTSAYAIDSASLGGSRKGSMDKALTLAAVLPSFNTYFKQVRSLGRPDLEGKVAAFTADFFDAIGTALTHLEQGGLAVWTLGERSVGGLRVPTVSICREINEFFGMRQVTEISRTIRSKRMPIKNSLGTTMINETLLVMNKPS